MIMMADKKKQITAILGPRPEGEKYESPRDGALTSVVEELIQAIHNKDVESAKAALRACFAELESEPHEEGPHTEG